MESYIQLTPSNNYLNNCVIKLHMKLLTPNLPLSNCVIKLHNQVTRPRTRSEASQLCGSYKYKQNKTNMLAPIFLTYVDMLHVNIV